MRSHLFAAKAPRGDHESWFVDCRRLQASLLINSCLSLRELKRTPGPSTVGAMNLFVCRREERSDVAIHLSTAFVDCRSLQASFAMTNMSSLAGSLSDYDNRA